MYFIIQHHIYTQTCLQTQGSQGAKANQMDSACPQGQDQQGKKPFQERKEARH